MPSGVSSGAGGLVATGCTMMARSLGMGRTIQSARDWTDFTFCHWAWRAAAFSKCMPEEASSRARPMSIIIDSPRVSKNFFTAAVFGGVLLGGAGLLAGLDAAAHLAVDAAGVFGVGGEVFGAATEFEEVEGGVAVTLGCGARGEGGRTSARGRAWRACWWRRREGIRFRW